MKEKKHKHTDWCSSKDQCIFIMNDGMKIGFNKKAQGWQVKMRCNRLTCTAWRYAYFNDHGILHLMGRIHAK